MGTRLVTFDDATNGVKLDQISTIAALLWPIGSIFLSVSPTSPQLSLGFGTWVAFGTGRTLVGLDISDPAFDVVEETGGSKTHTHAGHANHVVTQPANHANHVFTQPANHANHVVTQPANHSALTTAADSTTTGGTAKVIAQTPSAHTGTAVDAHSAHTGGAVDAHSAHSGTAVDAHSAHDTPSNVPPYIVVFMWKRTA